MKSRLTLIFAALVVLLMAMIWVVQDRTAPSAPLVLAAAEPAAPAAPQTNTPVVAAVPATPVAAPTATPPSESVPVVHVNETGDVEYTARAGDTVSQLAVALLGSDTKEHRAAVVDANPTLQANPDRVLEGYTYSIPPSSSAQGPAEAGAPAVAAAPVTNTDASPAVSGSPTLRYTAQAGDTVGVLAANLLGKNTPMNRDAIIAGNPSLRQDPDHLVAGKTYTIAAPNGLAANSDAVEPKAPTSQPDADDVTRISVGRTLRYTAKAGDTVSQLAVILLGSDTPVNRELITRSNPSLRADPDNLIAGQTYWINAPAAPSAH